MTTFDQLNATSRSFVEAARAKNVEDGLRRLLADLYPDNAHFIYELLQNAEDARATQLIFTLEPTKLTVEHDGARPFNLADIESITGIGDSTKADDPTRIGKFGVGFKAVFAYTSRPEIRSGEHSFAIHDLFVPERIPGQAPAGWTTFTFPFDSAHKRPEQARDEIARGLLELGENTLLFLESIRSVLYTLPDGSEGLLERRDLGNQRVAIGHESPEGSGESTWIRLIGPARIEEDGHEKTVTVAAAFRLADAREATPESNTSEPDKVAARSTLAPGIAPLEHGQVSIYFPAVKETSGLRFHVHAPFASTVARDSVRKTEGNRQLISAIGSLICEALPGFRDQGLIDDGLLATLPNAEDRIPEAFTPIRDLIVDAFNNTSITPVHGGGAFAEARKLVSSPSPFRRALTHPDLDLLCGLAWGPADSPRRWIASRDGDAGRFLRSLRVDEFGWTDLQQALDRVEEVFHGDLEEWFKDPTRGQDSADEDEADARLWLNWLATKDEKALRRMYAFLGEGAQERYPVQMRYSSIPLIRLVSREGVRHVRGRDTYLPASRSDVVSTRVPISLAVFPDDPANEKETGWLQAFYQRAGVKRWDAAAKTDQRLKPYRNGDFPEARGKRHFDDVRALAKYVREQPDRGALLRNERFLVGENISGGLQWTTAGRIFLDSPYEETGLASIFPALVAAAAVSGPRLRLWDAYFAEVEDMATFARGVGCKTALEVVEADVQKNTRFERVWWAARWTTKGVKKDWDIEHLDAAILSGNEALMRGLWRTVAAAGSHTSKAVFQANASTQRFEFPSQAAQKLMSTAWVLDRDGNLRVPASITERELADGLTLPKNRTLIHHLNFGLHATMEEMAQSSLAETAAVAGFGTVENMDFFKSLTRDKSPDEVSRLLERLAYELQESDIQGEPSADPESRAATVAADSEAAAALRYEQRERSVAVREAGQLERIKAYLREHYTNRQGRVVCQVCSQVMPFRIQEADYFEAVACVRGRKYDLYQNRLALCPVCAAKYRHARGTTDEELVGQLTAVEVTSGVTRVQIAVVLAKEEREMTFTARHFIDLKAVLKAKGEERDG